MQQHEASEADPAASLTPEVVPTASWRVESVELLGGARLRVAFVDGTSGEVEMAAFLAKPEITGTIFEPLRAPAVFASVAVVLGAVTWPCGADLAPDALYDAIREHGRLVLR